MFVILHVKKKSNAGVPGSLSALSRHIRAIFAVVSSSFSSLSSSACTFSLGERDVGLYYWVERKVGFTKNTAMRHRRGG